MRSPDLRLRLLWATAVFLAVASVAVLTSAESEMPEPAFAEVSDSVGPVVVELFTSQGCSSCPPADRLLPTLAEEGDAAVIPLAFHVDYWDYIGWEDPFASKRWTRRQAMYRDALKARSLYTPQMVVNGVAHATGSDKWRIERLVNEARRYKPVGRPVVAVEREGDRVRARITVDKISTESEDVEVVAVLFERRLETAVTAGENTGRSLREDYVVRDMKRVMSLAKAVDNPKTISFPLPEESRDREVGVVVMLQHAKTAAILGAAVDSVGA